MKRVWIVLALVVLVLCLGGSALWHLSVVTKELDAALVSLSESIEQQQDDLPAQAQAFEDMWEKHETMMMRYIHHDELDQITGVVARLKALAQHRDYGEIAAEVARLRHLILHIYEAELPSFSSIM